MIKTSNGLVLIPGNNEIAVFRNGSDVELSKQLGLLVPTNVAWADITVTLSNEQEVKLLWLPGADLSDDAATYLVNSPETVPAMTAALIDNLAEYLDDDQIVPVAAEHRKYVVEALGTEGHFKVSGPHGNIVFDDSRMVPEIESTHWVISLVQCKTCADDKPGLCITAYYPDSSTIVVPDGKTLGQTMVPYINAMMSYRGSNDHDDLGGLARLLSRAIGPDVGELLKKHIHYVTEAVAGPVKLVREMLVDGESMHRIAKFLLGGEVALNCGVGYISAFGRIEYYYADAAGQDTLDLSRHLPEALAGYISKFSNFELSEVTPERFNRNNMQLICRIGSESRSDPLEFRPFDFNVSQWLVATRTVRELGVPAMADAWVAVLVRCFMLSPFATKEQLADIVKTSTLTLNKELKDSWPEGYYEAVQAIVESW